MQTLAELIYAREPMQSKGSCLAGRFEHPIVQSEIPNAKS